MDEERIWKKRHEEVSDCTPERASGRAYRYCRFDGLQNLLRARRLGDKVFQDVVWWNSTALGGYLWASRCVFRRVSLHGLRKAVRFSGCGFDDVQFTGRTAAFELHPYSIVHDNEAELLREATQFRDFHAVPGRIALDISDATFEHSPYIGGLAPTQVRGRPGRDVFLSVGDILWLRRGPRDIRTAVWTERAEQVHGGVGVILSAVGDLAPAVQALLAQGRASSL